MTALTLFSANIPALGADPGQSVIVTKWPVARGVELLCLVDRRGESMCLYRMTAGPAGKLELVAARAIRFDLLLEDLNGAAPTPAQVRDRLRAEGRLPPDDADGPPAPGRMPMPAPAPAAKRPALPLAAPPTLAITPLQVADDQQVLCVIDTSRGVLCVYDFDSKRRRLRLVAARKLQYDFLLEELNLEGLSPREVEQAVNPGR